MFLWVCGNLRTSCTSAWLTGIFSPILKQSVDISASNFVNSQSTNILGNLICGCKLNRLPNPMDCTICLFWSQKLEKTLWTASTENAVYTCHLPFLLGPHELCIWCKISVMLIIPPTGWNATNGSAGCTLRDCSASESCRRCPSNLLVSAHTLPDLLLLGLPSTVCSASDLKLVSLSCESISLVRYRDPSIRVRLFCGYGTMRLNRNTDVWVNRRNALPLLIPPLLTHWCSCPRPLEFALCVEVCGGLRLLGWRDETRNFSLYAFTSRKRVVWSCMVGPAT